MEEDDLIDSYSRAQAIADGVLIDVTELAQTIGIRYPTAVTEALFQGYIKPPLAHEDSGQSVNGRLHDVLFLLVLSIKGAHRNTNEIHFKVAFLMDSMKTEVVAVWALVDGGDDGKPVITIMLEGED